MRFSFALSSALAFAGLSTVVAQSDAVPSDASPSCATFLNALNGDNVISTYTNNIVTATNAYAKKVNGSGSNDITGSLDPICNANANQATFAAYIRQNLSDFSSACKTDMVAKRTNVTDIYDLLYLLVPFSQAVCTKDTNGQYCVSNIASYAKTSTSKRSPSPAFSLLSDSPLRRAHHHIQSLAERQATTGNLNGDASQVNTDDQSQGFSNNLAYLFLQPTMDKSVLCTNCTSGILAAYILFETSIPYATGLSGSPKFAGQSALWNATQHTCGNEFNTAILTATGTESFVTGGAMARLGLSPAFAVAASTVVLVTSFLVTL